MKELVSKLPPNCCEVSSTTSAPNATSVILEFAPESALAKAITVLPFATVTLVPVPVPSYLNTTF